MVNNMLSINILGKTCSEKKAKLFILLLILV